MDGTEETKEGVVNMSLSCFINLHFLSCSKQLCEKPICHNVSRNDILAGNLNRPDMPQICLRISTGSVHCVHRKETPRC